MASHTISGGPWPSGVTVTVYLRRLERPMELAAPPGQSAVTAATAGASTVTFSGLAEGERYWAVGRDGTGAWRWVGFRPTPLFQKEPAGALERVRQLEERWAPDQSTFAVVREAPLNARYPEYEALVVNSDWAPAFNQAAADARPSAGKVLIPSGEYRVESTLDFGGVSVEGIPRSAGTVGGQTVLRHFFNGNLIDAGASGMVLRNLSLYEGDATLRTGAAIVATSTADDIGGAIILEHLTISSEAGWERLMVFDGTAQPAFGVRKIFVLNCDLFGARTAGESIVLRNGVHVKFVGGQLDPAPLVGGQGIRIEGTVSTDVMFSGYEVIGDFYTEATGDLVFMGRITGTITCAASSERNVFIGRMGNFTNNGAATNMQIGTGSSGTLTPSLNVDNTFSGNVTVTGRVGAQTVSGVSRLRVTGAASSAAGVVELLDRVSVSGAHSFGSFPNPGSGRVYADGGLAVGNTAAATTPGTVVKKMPVYDGSGNVLGYVPLYNAIT